jgi:hypothetical protein
VRICVCASVASDRLLTAVDGVLGGGEPSPDGRPDADGEPRRSATPSATTPSTKAA